LFLLVLIFADKVVRENKVIVKMTNTVTPTQLCLSVPSVESSLSSKNTTDVNFIY